MPFFYCDNIDNVLFKEKVKYIFLHTYLTVSLIELQFTFTISCYIIIFGIIRWTRDSCLYFLLCFNT